MAILRKRITLSSPPSSFWPMHRLSDTSAMFSTIIIWKQYINRSQERERERERSELLFTYVIDLCTAKPHSTRVQSAITERKEEWSSDYSGFRSKELYSVKIQRDIQIQGVYLLPSITMPPVVEERTQ